MTKSGHAHKTTVSRTTTSKQQLRAQIADFSPAATVLWDTAGRLIYANRQARSLLGLARGRLDSWTHHDRRWKITALDGSPYPEELAPFRLVMCRGEPVTDVRYRLQAGVRRRPAVTVQAVLLKDPQGQAAGVIATYTEITGRLEEEWAIQRINRALRTVSEVHRVLIHARSETQLLPQVCRNIVQAGGYLAAWIGYPGKSQSATLRPVAWYGIEEGSLEAHPLTWNEVSAGQDPAGTRIKAGNSVVARDILAKPELRLWRDDVFPAGYISSLALPLMIHTKFLGVLIILAGWKRAFDAPEITLLTGLASNLSQSIASLRTGSALAESEARYHLLFDTSPDALFILDHRGRILDANQVARERYGYSREELLTMTAGDLAAPDLRDQAGDFIRQVLQSGEPFEWRQCRKDGTEIPVEIRARPIVIAGRKCIFSSVRDISLRKQAKIVQERLLARERAARAETEAARQQQAQILERVTDGFVALDTSFNYTYVNPRGGELLGRKPEQLVGRNYWEEYPEARPTPFARAYQRALREQVTIVLEDYYEPWKRWFENRIYPSPEGLTIYFSDITTRKQVETALRRHDAILKAVAYASQIFLKTSDWDRHINEVLGLLGQASQVSRVYIFENQPSPEGELFTSRRYEWVGPGIAPQIDNPELQNFPLRTAGFSRWVEMLSRDNALTGKVSTFPAGERTMLAAQGIYSLVVMPISVAGRWWGFIGFDECSHEREWQPAEIEALRIAANTFGAAIEYRQSEQMLRTSEQKFAVMFKKAPFVAALASLPEGVMVEVNEEFENLLGYSAREALGRTALDLNLYPDPEQRQRSIARIREQGFVRDLEMNLRTKSGVIRDFLVNSDFVQIGQDKYVLTTARDITTRKRAEQALQESEKRFKRAVVEAPFPMLIHAEDGEIMEVNRAWTEISGYTHQDIPTLADWAKQAYGQGKTAVLADIERLYDLKERVYEGEYVITTRSGEHRTWEFSSAPLGHLPDGRRLVLSMAVDISARKQAEEALRESEERYRLLVNESPYAIGIHQDGKIVYVNPAALKLLGARKPEELIGMFIRDLIHPETWEDARERIARMLKGESGLYPSEDRYVRLDGRVVPVQVTAAPFIHAGRPAIQVIALDITARKQAEAALHRNRELLNTAQTISKLGGWEYDVAAKHILWTDEVYRIYAVSKEYDPNDISRDISYYAPEDQPRIVEAFQKAVDEGRPYDLEMRFRAHDGTPKWVRTMGNPVLEGGNVVRVVGNIMDITERKQAMQMLERTARRLAIQRRLDQAILALQAPEEVARVTVEQFRQLVEYDRASVALFDHRSDTVWVLALYYDNKILTGLKSRFRPTDFGNLQAFERGKIRNRGNLGRKKLLTRFEKSILAEQMQACVIIPLIARDTLRGLFLFARTQPDKFSAGDLEVMQSTANQLAIGLQQARLYAQIQKDAAELERRVTERTRELESANAEMEAFTYSVSHDLRAPLRTMSGFAKALVEDYGDKLTTTGRDFIQRIVGASHQMETLIQDLLNYSRLSRAEFERTPVPLEAVLKEVRHQVQNDLKASRGRLTLPRHLPAVSGNQTLLIQILVNLVSNALKFVAPGTRPHIRIATRATATGVRISVKDNGIGIEPEYHDRIFRVFERLHGVEAYPGTGIGLAIVKKGIEKLGGRLGLKSAPGQGSTFWVELPRDPNPTAT